MIVASTCEPAPNLLLLDKLTAIAVSKQIKPVIVLQNRIYVKRMSLSKFIITPDFLPLPFLAGMERVCLG